MVSEEADRDRRGDRRRCVAAHATRGIGAILLVCCLWAGPSGGSAQESRSLTTPGSHQVEQALRALARGLADRAKELGQGIGQESGDDLATGSITAPFPPAWIAPVPLAYLPRLQSSLARQSRRDIARLFEPAPLGTPEALNRTQLAIRDRGLDAGRLPAAPPSSVPGPPSTIAQPSVAASQAARDRAALPEPQLQSPPPASVALVPLPPATATEIPPPAPPISPQRQAAIPAPDTPPAAILAKPDDRKPSKPETRQPDATPAEAPARRPAAQPTEAAEQANSAEADPKADHAHRKKSGARIAARPVEEPERDEEPEVREPEAKPSRRTKPERSRSAGRLKPSVSLKAARAPALVSPEVTSSLTRSSPLRLQAKAPARLVRDAQRPDADIPIIPLPDALRPTRPPAGSPL